MIDYDRLPEHMRGAARRYVEQGIKPGVFLTAVLCNNLKTACIHADSINLAAMRDWAIWLLNEPPPACHGSTSRVSAWRKKGGALGKSPQEAGSGP